MRKQVWGVTAAVIAALAAYFFITVCNRPLSDNPSLQEGRDVSISAHAPHAGEGWGTQERQLGDQSETGKEPLRSFFPESPIPDELERAIKKGARAKVTLRVVDSTGIPVPNARVRLNFTFFDRENNYETGMTDAGGLFTAEKDCMSGCNWSIEKDGYYRTDGGHTFFTEINTTSVKNGRWLPWNPTLETVLKEKRNPIQMIVRSIISKMPINNTPVGFDFEKGDWVAPYGNGSEPDMTLTYVETKGENTWRRYDFSIHFTNGQDGACLKQKDEYSQFQSDYEAPTNLHDTVFDFVYERTNDKIVQEKRVTQNDVLVFRVRTKRNGHGNVIEARYGKIYGPFKFADGPEKFISFKYFFNPTSNDRNLESTETYP
jgi:hypothetical protein